MCRSESVSKTNQICCHNNYDNIRVNKVTKHLVLRCRDCGDQIKGSSSLIWNTLRCQEFTKNGNCQLGTDCGKLHIHYKKQRKEDRVNTNKHVISLVIDELTWSQSLASQSTSTSSVGSLSGDECPPAIINQYRHDPYGEVSSKFYC